MSSRLLLVSSFTLLALAACSKDGPCGPDAKLVKDPDETFKKLGGFPPGANACSFGPSNLRVAYPGKRDDALAKWESYATAQGWKKTENAKITKENADSAMQHFDEEKLLYAKGDQLMVVNVTVSKVNDVVVSPVFIDCPNATSLDDKELCGK